MNFPSGLPLLNLGHNHTTKRAHNCPLLFYALNESLRENLNVRLAYLQHIEEVTSNK